MVFDSFDGFVRMGNAGYTGACYIVYGSYGITEFPRSLLLLSCIRPSSNGDLISFQRDLWIDGLRQLSAQQSVARAMEWEVKQVLNRHDRGGTSSPPVPQLYMGLAEHVIDLQAGSDRTGTDWNAILQGHWLHVRVAWYDIVYKPSIDSNLSRAMFWRHPCCCVWKSNPNTTSHHIDST